MFFFQLLDACVNNCGKEFRLEVASREFENEFKRLLSRSQPKVQEKLRGVLKSWAEGEFKGDSQLSLITGLYSTLKKEGVDFSSGMIYEIMKINNVLLSRKICMKIDNVLLSRNICRKIEPVTFTKFLYLTF